MIAPMDPGAGPLEILGSGDACVASTRIEFACPIARYIVVSPVGARRAVPVRITTEGNLP